MLWKCFHFKNKELKFSTDAENILKSVPNQIEQITTKIYVTKNAKTPFNQQDNEETLTEIKITGWDITVITSDENLIKMNEYIKRQLNNKKDPVHTPNK